MGLIQKKDQMTQMSDKKQGKDTVKNMPMATVTGEHLLFSSLQILWAHKHINVETSSLSA